MRYVFVVDEEDNPKPPSLGLHVGAGTLLVSLLGSLMHFVYKWSNCDPFVAIFCAVNESTWEHAKIMLFPLLLWWTVTTGDAAACCWAAYSALAFLLVFNGLSLLGGFDRLNYIYSLDAYNIYDVSTNASPLIQQEAGARLKSAFTLELVHDARDRPFVPTRGNRTSLSAQVAGGPLGGDTDIYGFQARSAQYIPVWFDHVLSLRGQLAFVDSYNGAERVPLFDRLFLGGPYSLRGYKFREVGPTDGEPNNEPIGGQSLFFVSAEYNIPIIEKIRIATFVDAGIVWSDPYVLSLQGLNSDFGLGIRFDFPGFPIQLDYAWPIHAEDYNNHPSGRFSFSIGYQY